MKRILIVGNGGREHALGWNLSKEEDSKIFYIPAEKSAIEISEFIKKEKIGLTVIGSEEPLERGIVDSLNIMGILEVFGPTRQMARLEWDKFYSYDIMDKLGIPQARSVKCFYNDDLKKALKIFDQPVLKSRWLSKGKGVRVYSSQGEARRAGCRADARSRGRHAGLRPGPGPLRGAQEAPGVHRRAGHRDRPLDAPPYPP